MRTDRFPPKNLDAEEAVIGSVLLDGDLIRSLTLQVDDFYHEIHGFIYSSMLKMKEAGKSINQITLAQKLDEDGKLEACGGVAYLSHLISITPTSMDCLHYAEIVQKLSNSRKLIVAGEAITKMGYDSDIEGINKADDMIVELRKRSGSSPIATPRERVELMTEHYTELSNTEDGVAIETGFTDLDYRIGGGFHKGEYILLAGKTGMGKTSAMQFIANHVSRRHKVLFCSAEMGIKEISHRDVATLTGEPINVIRSGVYSEDVEKKIMTALGQMDMMEVYYNKEIPLTTSNILQQAITMQLRYGLGLLVIDYLGILADDYGRSAYDRISYISRKLKQMARQLDVPVLVGQQLSRPQDRRNENKRPVLPDLRDSGSLEQDADLVLFLHREDYYFKTEEEWNAAFSGGNIFYKSYPKGIVEILIAKQRQGPSGKYVKVLWDETHQNYKNLAREE